MPAANQPGVPPSERPLWLDELAHRVDLYGRFSGHLAFTDDDMYFANNGSRFGIKAEQRLENGFRLIGQGEWKVNLGQGDTRYNVSENPDTGLATIDTSTKDAIGTRLGFVGMHFGEYGTLTLGKQWGVYYDVSEWTDRYAVFGARGSSTYNAGTDGGQTGEGRANDAVAYRVALGPLRLGAQAQFLDTRDRVVDGLSGSLVYEVCDGFAIGVAYSHAFLDFDESIVGYDGGAAQALTGGINFDDGRWMISALDTWTRNHEFVLSDAATVAYDTLGAEVLMGYRIGGVLMPYGGIDFAIPRQIDTRFVDPDYGTRDVLGGIRWLFDPKAGSFVYLEGRTGQTRDTAGARAEDMVTLGIRFNYSLRRALGLP
ncbi:MAG TPA: porin [Polyangiaceae bacterium]|nr:porin [Polyangiaceae bacterium]